MVERGETSACMQERGGLHRKTPEEGAAPGKKQSETKKIEINFWKFKTVFCNFLKMH